MCVFVLCVAVIVCGTVKQAIVLPPCMLRAASCWGVPVEHFADTCMVGLGCNRHQASIIGPADSPYEYGAFFLQV